MEDSLKRFWDEKVAMASEERVARINGEHYMVGTRGADVPKRDKGMGGSEFTIVFKDGREVVTDDLWHQGTIPEEYREVLPNNAVFRRRINVKHIG